VKRETPSLLWESRFCQNLRARGGEVYNVVAAVFARDDASEGEEG